MQRYPRDPAAKVKQGRFAVIVHQRGHRLDRLLDRVPLVRQRAEALEDPGPALARPRHRGDPLDVHGQHAAGFRAGDVERAGHRAGTAEPPYHVVDAEAGRRRLLHQAAERVGGLHDDPLARGDHRGRLGRRIEVHRGLAAADRSHRTADQPGYFSRYAAAAAVKHSSGARRIPAPICPPFWPASPPSITGVVPVAVTRKTSMPTGVPRKPKYGILKSGCSATVMSYMAEFIRTISAADPPWYACRPNAAAWANPPRPTVSVMWLSPPIHCTSSSVNPSNNLQETSGSGPRNHSSPSPLTLIAKFRQLIVIAVTTLEPWTSLAASAIAFAEAMDSRRKE